MSAVNGEREALPQENGPEIELRVFGDEFYARYEILDGFTVVYDDAQGLFCYAAHDPGGALRSSGIPASRPAPDGTAPHLRPVAEARWGTLEQSFRETRPTDDVFRDGQFLTLGPDNGLLTGRKLFDGPVRGLTVLVQFRDVKTGITAADVDALMNAGDYTANGNACSVRQYFQLMSNGALDYTNDVVGPITLDNDRSHYVKKLLVREALEKVAALGVDLRRFDSRGEGIVDALSFLYAGPKVYLGELWPHNSIEEVDLGGGMRTHFYMLTALGGNATGLTIGTICHENGHMLCRFPDLYDYGKRDGDTDLSGGMGRYCLMSSGNHLDEGRTPAPICAYLRDLAGWCTEQVDLNAGGTFTARHGAYGQALRYSTGRDHEYFLIENRFRTGFDAHLPASGLAVYHCDTRGSNEWEDGTDRKHYQCALLQADGRFDLERTPEPPRTSADVGDATDLYATVAGVALSLTTTPSSRLWDKTDSGFRIEAIGAPGPEISFVVGPPRMADLESTAPIRDSDVRTVDVARAEGSGAAA